MAVLVNPAPPDAVTVAALQWRPGLVPPPLGPDRQPSADRGFRPAALG